MAYTQFDNTKPSASVNGTTFATDTRAQLAALRDAVVLGNMVGWAYSKSGGTAEQPATMWFSKGTERLRAQLTWGTAGGSADNVTQMILSYSSNSGSTYDTIGTQTINYDTDGNVTSTSWS